LAQIHEHECPRQHSNQRRQHVGTELGVGECEREIDQNEGERNDAQEQDIAECILGESRVDARAELAHAPSGCVGEQVACSKEHECRTDRRRHHDQYRTDPAAEQEADRQRHHQGHRQTERGRGDIDDERAGQRKPVMRVGERQQGVTVGLDRIEIEILRAIECEKRDYGGGEYGEDD
jgi:hypothetical protein